MNRGVLLVSLLLLVAGLELTAGVVSGSVAELRSGLNAVARFPETGEFPFRFAGGFLLLVAGLAGTALAGWTSLRKRRLPQGRACPRCGNGTQRVRRRLRHRLLTRFLGVKVVRRQCTDCGWVGLARGEAPA